MANRIPLVVDSTALSIKELPANDQLDLAGGGIINASDITMNANTTLTVTASVTGVVDLGNVSSSATVNVMQGNYFTASVGGDVTFYFNSAHTGSIAESFILELANGGAFTVTWPTTVRWPSGTAPTLSSANTDLLAFVTDDNGTIWRGVSQLNYSTS